MLDGSYKCFISPHFIKFVIGYLLDLVRDRNDFLVTAVEWKVRISLFSLDNHCHALVYGFCSCLKFMASLTSIPLVDMHEYIFSSNNRIPDEIKKALNA